MASQPARRSFEPVVTWDPEVSEYLEACFGAAKFGAISAALCRPPPSTCLRVNTRRASLQDVLDHIVSTAAQSTNTVEPPPPAPYIHALAPAIIMPGRGPLDVDYSCTNGKEVVISRKAGEAVLRGAPLYVPGVLACSAGVEAGDLVAVSVALEKPGSQTSGITRGTVIGSEAWHRAGSPDRSGLYIGVGRCQVGRTELFRVESGVAVVMVSPVFQVPSCQGLEGKVMLQNLPSVAAALALAPAPGSRVLDMCAAPGGKTTMLAQLMGDLGEVVALDRSHAKAAEITSLASELGMTCVKVYKMDATKAVLKHHRQQQQQEQRRPRQQEQQQQQQLDPEQHQVQQQEHGEQLEQQQAGQHSGVKQRQHQLKSVDQEQQQQQQLQQHERLQQKGWEHTAVAEPGQGTVRVLEDAPASAADLQGSAKILKRQHRKAAAMAARGLQPKQAQADSSEASPSGFPPESFDHILVDAPCSALGLRPRLLQTATLTYLHQCAEYQRRILDAAVLLLRPGGTLVFSTCTFNPGENEANVRYVLDSYPWMKLVQQVPRLGGPGLAGEHPGPASLLFCRSTKGRAQEQQAGEVLSGGKQVPAGPTDQSSSHGSGTSGHQHKRAKAQHSQADGAGAAREVWLSEQEACLVQRFDPTQDTIAFFIAKFLKDPCFS